MRSIYVLTGVTLASFSSMSMIRLTVPLLLTHLEAPLSFIAVAMAAHSIIIALSSIPLGLASDRLGRKKMLLLGVSLMIISSILFIGVNDSLAILAPLVLLAVGWGAFEPTIQALVGDVAKPGEMGRALGNFSATLQAGSSVGPAIAGILITSFGFQAPFIASLIFVLLTVTLAQLALRQGSGNRPRAEQAGLRESMTTLVSSKSVTTGWAAIIFSFTIVGGFETFFPVYASHIGLEPWIIGILFGFQTFIGMFVRIPVGALLDRLRDKLFVMNIGLMINAITVAIIPFFTEPILLLLIMAAMIFGRATTNVGGMTLVTLGSSARERGLAVGLMTTFRHGGLTLGPAIFGVIASSLGLTMGFLGLGAVALPGLGLMTFLRKKLVSMSS